MHKYVHTYFHTYIQPTQLMYCVRSPLRVTWKHNQMLCLRLRFKDSQKTFVVGERPDPTPPSLLFSCMYVCMCDGRHLPHAVLVPEAPAHERPLRAVGPAHTQVRIQRPILGPVHLLVSKPDDLHTYIVHIYI